MMNWHGWNHMSGYGWVGMTLMFVAWIVVLLVVIYIVAKLLNGSPQGRPSADDHDHAIEILRERYARGGLSDEKYQQARETLGGVSSGAARETR